MSEVEVLKNIAWSLKWIVGFNMLYTFVLLIVIIANKPKSATPTEPE